MFKHFSNFLFTLYIYFSRIIVNENEARCFNFTAPQTCILDAEISYSVLVSPESGELTLCWLLLPAFMAAVADPRGGGGRNRRAPPPL